MNHLAHALLAGGDPDLEVGGVLGDFVRGRPGPELPSAVRAGIRLHRAIDGFTDGHAQVAAARARFTPPFRRYAGILLDVWFDHCLALDFGRWSALPLEPFSQRLRTRLHARQAMLPAGAERFLRYMDANRLPAGYAEPAMLARALAGLGDRLQRANPVADALPVLLGDAPALQAHFEAFFPDLRDFAADWRRRHARERAEG